MPFGLVSAWSKLKRSKPEDLTDPWIYKPIEYWQLKDQNTPLDRHPVSSVFTLKEMEEATNSFSDENLVGKGGFGRVYKGTLRSGGVRFSFYFHHGSKNHNLIIEFVILYTKYPT